MVSLRPIFSQHLTLFRTQNPSQFLKSLNLTPFLKSDFVSSRLNLFPVSLRPFSSSARFHPKLKNLINGRRKFIKKKPLDILFKEAVGLVEKIGNVEEDLGGVDGELKKRLKKLEVEVRLKMKEKSENGGEEEGENAVESKQRILFKLFEENPRVPKENGEMKGRIGNGKEEDLVMESKQGGLSGSFARKENKDGENLRNWDQRMEDNGVHKENGEMKEETGSGEEEDLVKKSKQSGLFELFARKEDKDGGDSRVVDHRMEDVGVDKDLSPDMIMFVTHLYKEGYFKNSNFVPRDKFVVGCFENGLARDFLKFAAEQFGKDNQDIATQLSARDLRKVALFGCPNLTRKNIFSAKRMRTFFKIQENTVCDRCVLKKSCEFVNQTVWKGDTKVLNLGDVMRLITLYALESVPSELVVPAEIKSSVGKLLSEAINLSAKKIS